VTGRLVIEGIRPATPNGRSAKAIVGESVRVTVVMFRDGHDPIAGRVLLYEGDGRPSRQARPIVGEAPLVALGNDEWAASVTPRSLGPHHIVVEGWTDKPGADDDRTRSDPAALWVDREQAMFGAWYELFPRSFGGFKGVAAELPAIAAMGFDIVYLPPIHPIGVTFRKGPGNTLTAGPDDPGSPWAIGSALGGHTAVNPELGTEQDFRDLVRDAQDLGMEIALDYALQCSPDHPWVTEHPEWFHHRADGTIACAENPPKIYQDIYPLNFWPPAESDREAMWAACKHIFDHWIAQGVRVFRVDNPHTKPMAFWEWVIA
jgi:hypothetical protein